MIGAKGPPLIARLILGVLTITALVYWPVWNADFVWDDVICFHDAAWLRVGDAWKQYMFSGFCDWTNYFRPLPVALFTLQLRLFDAAPGPMHLVSLAMHLANVTCVAMLGRRLQRSSGASVWPVVLAAAVFALHPALVEPIVWLNTQTELLVTLFMLLGLLLNALVERTLPRAMAVAGCFFLAACSKESALAFPPLLVLLDWLRTDYRLGTWRDLQTLLRRQRSVYLAVLVAGLAYIALRAVAFGYVVRPSPGLSVALADRVREIGYIYMTYWRILLWPMYGTGPIHIIEAARFTLSPTAWLLVFASLALALFGAFGALRRNLAGGAVAGITVALLPVLHLVPVRFDDSLYHERYVMMPLALGCALMAAYCGRFVGAGHKFGPRLSSVLVVTVVWLAVAVVAIRATLPLWSDEERLWRWVLRANPDSLTAQDRLLATYIDRGESARARELSNALMRANTRCPFCTLDAAQLAIEDGALEYAAAILDNIHNNPVILAYNQRFLQRFILVSGMLSEARGDLPGAESAYRDAIAVDPLMPDPQFALAQFLARRGRGEEAAAAAAASFALYAPDDRAARQREFRMTRPSIP